MLRCGSLPARAVKMKTHYIESGVLYVLVSSTTSMFLAMEIY